MPEEFAGRADELIVLESDAGSHHIIAWHAGLEVGAEPPPEYLSAIHRRLWPPELPTVAR